MKFGNLKKGDTLYCATVKNSELVDEEIKEKQILETCIYMEDNINVEIRTSDGTSIMPNSNEEYVVKGIDSLSKIIEPFNFTVYAVSYKVCYDVIKKIVSTKMMQIEGSVKKFNTQMVKLCLMNSIVNKIGSKTSVIVKPIYTD